MKVVITVQHPAHVHFFRHAMDELEGAGHEVHVFARDKEITTELLDAFDIPYEVLAGKAGSLLSLAATQLGFEYRLYRRARRIDPDVMAAIGGVTVAHVAPLVGARSVVFTDTEHATLINTLTHPVADSVYTPECYTDDVGTKQVRYPGYHELAYLHPARYSPNPDVFHGLDASPDDRLAVVRLNGWDSSHDVGQTGLADVHETVERLRAAGAAVLVTSEVPLPSDLRRYRVDIDPRRIHDLLAHADLFVGEGATMAAESAVLGTPAVYANSLRMGYTDELDEEYGLLFNFPGEEHHDAALDRAVGILESDAASKWERRRERLLDEKVDTTEVVLDALRGTPETDARSPVATTVER